MMNDSLIEDIYACMHLHRIHESAPYWYGDFAKLAPTETKRQIAMIDAELSVMCGLASSVDRALKRRFGTTDLAKIHEQPLTDILREAVDAINYGVSASSVQLEEYSGDPYQRVACELVSGLDQPLQDPNNCVRLLTRSSLVNTSLPFTRESVASLLRECYERGWDDGIPRDPAAREHYGTIRKFLELALSFGIPNVDPLETNPQGFQLLFKSSHVEDRHPLFATR